MSERLICTRCNIALEPKNIVLKYMGMDFSAEAPCCPSCGEAYIAEEVARKKIKEAEQMLEEK